MHPITLKNCKGYCIHFKTEFIQPLLNKSIAEEFPFFHFDTKHIINIKPDESKLIQQSFVDILTEYKRFSPEKDYLLRNYILILLLRVREIYTSHGKQLNKTLSRGAQLANRFKYLVEKHFVESRSVQDYANKLHINPNHLSDIVKNAFGRSPLEMIHDMLFLEAKVLLGSTDKTITEIAHALQFGDHAHFSHFIKKRTGFTPLEFRKKL
jgi:AraC-like DNA-binding protein